MPVNSNPIFQPDTAFHGAPWALVDVPSLCIIVTGYQEKLSALGADESMLTRFVRRLLIGIALPCAALCAEVEAVAPEVAPMIALLQAAKDANVAAFRDAYSKRIREDKEQGDWGKNLREAQKNLNKYFGDYQLREFNFEYIGNGEKGVVTLFHKGKETEKRGISLAVTKEGVDWKLDER